MKRTNPGVILLLIGCFWFSGCVIGPTTKEIRETMEPAGVHVTIQLNDGEVTGGELLNVSAEEIAVLTAGGVALISVEEIDRLTTEQPPVAAQSQAGRLSVDDVKELRPLSRFPAGFPPGVLDTLINLHGTNDFAPGEGG